MIFRVALLILLSATPAYAGRTGTWLDATTHKFFPSIVRVLLDNGFYLLPNQALVGDCSDGNVTISAGTTTLTRDMFYNNLTINGTGQLNVAAQRVYWCGTLDLSSAPAGAITGGSNNGSNGANGGGAGNGGNAIAVGTNIASRAGGNGGAGSTTAGAQGATGTGGNTVTNAQGGGGGAGGTGTSGAGGAQRNPAAVNDIRWRDIIAWALPQTGAGGQVFTSGSGAGGGGGGGDTTNSGGGGGAAGGSAGTVWLSGNILKTGGSSVAGTIIANGGTGGNGGSPAAGNTGGGGAGGGGAGGWIAIKYNSKTGTAVTNLVQALTGANGTAGTGHGTGTNGAVHATSGQPGVIQAIDLGTGANTTSTTGSLSL